jgi:hypothetical protein
VARKFRRWYLLAISTRQRLTQSNTRRADGNIDFPTVLEFVMGEPTERHEVRPRSSKLLRGVLLPVAAITASLAVMALIYLGYDVIRAKAAPCDAIFQQTAVNLSTHLQILKVEGELRIGREAVNELDERAQMAALDLKTCCTVLDAGRIDPEQFLQCKSKARAYDARLQTIATLVGDMPKDVVTASNSNTAPVQANPTIVQAVEAARTVSQEFNRQVVQVAKDQALQSLQTAPAANVSIDATEREPNDDGLNANAIPLDKAVKASITTAKDSDFYTFDTPTVYRDWIRIDLKNLSTTLDPNLELFDAAKASLGAVHNATAGGDVSYEYVAPPVTKYSVRASSYYGQSTGVYLITVHPEKAYDAYEPNDDILSAKRITEAAAIDAKIMDKDDVDYFSVEGVSTGERSMMVTLVNKSATLHPNVVVYDANKGEIGNAHNATPGGDLSYDFKAPKGPIYIRVSDYYVQSQGAYALTLAKQ